MAVRLIAVDMDGTFLDDQMSYDRTRFARLHRVMRERGIRFVVASGNQYFQLRSFFPDRDPDDCGVIYVAENGAFVTDGATEYYESAFPASAVTSALGALERTPAAEIVLCGKHAAYALLTADPAFLDIMRLYYHRLELVESLHGVDDQILKLALATPMSDTPRIVDELRRALDGIAVPVTSGHGFVDLIQPGVNKGSALARLAAALGIDRADMIAFGDGGNDIEMLEYVGCGVAMANAPDHVKAHADTVTASNNHSGVLTFIERALTQPS